MWGFAVQGGIGVLCLLGLLCDEPKHNANPPPVTTACQDCGPQASPDPPPQRTATGKRN